MLASTFIFPADCQECVCRFSRLKKVHLRAGPGKRCAFGTGMTPIEGCNSMKTTRQSCECGLESSARDAATAQSLEEMQVKRFTKFLPKRTVALRNQA